MTGYWNHIPLFRYLVPFVFGIIISIQLQLQAIAYVYYFFGLVFIYFLFQIIHKLSSSFRLQPVHGFLFGTHLEVGMELVTDMLTDGSIVGLVNMAISALAIFLLGGLE